MSALSIVRRTLSLRKDVVFLLVLFTLSVSLLSLAIPIGVQTIVNTLAFSIYSQPIFILTTIIFVLLLLAGIVRLCQMMLLENAQQEIFVRFALLIANHLPRLKTRLLESHRGPELINRFFEIVSIQKTLSIVMIYLVIIVVQSFTGLILLALYHPYLLILDILLLCSVVLALFIPMKKALSSAYEESDQKHYVAAWLEEYLHCPQTVKFSNQKSFTLGKVDGHLLQYLKARRGLFRGIVKHFIGFYGIYMLSNAALLGVGGWLVIKQQLSLGQFVASEIVLNSVVSSFLRLVYYLGDLYALAASSRKINSVFELEYDPELDSTSDSSPLSTDDMSYRLTFEKLCYEDQNAHVILDNLSFDIQPGEMVAISSQQSRAKTELIDILVGINEQTSGFIRLNDRVLNMRDKLLMRESTALVNSIEMFPATLLENICLQQSTFTNQEIYHLLDQLGLKSTIEKLSDGLESHILSHRNAFSHPELYKLCVCRALVAKPKLLILDNIIDALSPNDIKRIMSAIQSLPHSPTTLFGVNNQAHLSLFSRVITL